MTAAWSYILTAAGVLGLYVSGISARNLAKEAS